VKLYNKKKESNLDIKNLTRIEVSGVETGNMYWWFLNSYEFNLEMLPDLFLTEYAYCLDDYRDTTLLGLLYAVQNRL